MSQENVETVRACLNAWNRGDWDAARVAAAPDVVLDATGIAGEWRGVHRGRDQVKRQWDSFVEPWRSVRSDGRFAGRDGIEVQTKTGFASPSAMGS